MFNENAEHARSIGIGIGLKAAIIKYNIIKYIRA